MQLKIIDGGQLSQREVVNKSQLLAMLHDPDLGSLNNKCKFIMSWVGGQVQAVLFPEESTHVDVAEEKLKISKESFIGAGKIGFELDKSYRAVKACTHVDSNEYGRDCPNNNEEAKQLRAELQTLIGEIILRSE